VPDTEVRNLLYRHPEYYELVYPEPDEATPRMCSRMLERFLPLPPRSILDVGCGTGRDLDVLSRTCPDCWGVDLLPAMVEYAGRMHPHLTLQVGDMRSFRLGRTFDAIMCMGSAFMYALTNADLDRTLAAFAAHAHEGTVLILDLNNAASYFGKGFRPRVETVVQAPELTARAVAENSFDRRLQLLVRRRLWTFAGGETVEDYCRYRLLFPAELERLLEEHGFGVVGMYDNKELEATDLSGPRLYVAALRRG
jgi:SAM-dependent methyltransferase